MVVGITTIIIGCTKRCAIGMFSLADVIAIKADVCLVFGRCYCHVAGGVATIYVGVFVGRCYSHVAGVIATVM